MSNQFIIFVIIIILICVVLYPFNHFVRNHDERVDVAIIGGGISGGYLSYKLRNYDPNLKVKIYEKNDSIGGRLLSSWDPIYDKKKRKNQWINEYGGMRIFPNLHKRMVNLLNELNVDIHPHTLTDPKTFYYDYNEEKRILLNKLDDDHFKKLLKVHDIYNPNDKHKEIYKQTLHKYSVDDLWKKYAKQANLTEKDKKYWEDTIGYDDIGEISAAQWRKETEMLSISNSNDQYLVKDGWKQIVEKLIGNTDISYHKTLINIEKDNDSINHLYFEDGTHVMAKYIFITVPIKNLKYIQGINHELVQNINNNLVNWPGTKTFITFNYPWWKKDFQILSGRSVTNGHLRMIFYWDSDTILCYTAGKGKGDSLSFIRNKGMEKFKQFMVDELSIAHYGKKGMIPQPIYVGFKDWNMICTWWTSNSRVELLQDEIKYPCKNNKNVYYSNSNITDEQGWMEGSIKSADKVLDCFLKSRII